MLQVYIFRDTGSHSISRNESEWQNAFIASPRADSFQVNGRYPPANYWVTSALQDFGILWAVSSQPMPALSGCRTWKNTTKHLLQRCGVWIGGKRLLTSHFLLLACFYSMRRSHSYPPGSSLWHNGFEASQRRLDGCRIFGDCTEKRGENATVSGSWRHAAAQRIHSQVMVCLENQAQCIGRT